MRRAQLLTDLPVLYYSLAQPDNVLKLNRLFDAGVSLILNLAVRDEEAKRLLGCLLTVGTEQAAKARASTWEADRGHKHVLLIDEAPLFLSQSGEALGTMLSQTRKFGIHVGIAHQDWSQAAIDAWYGPEYEKQFETLGFLHRVPMFGAPGDGAPNRDIAADGRVTTEHPASIAIVLECLRQSLITYQPPVCLCTPEARAACRWKALVLGCWVMTMPDHELGEWSQQDEHDWYEEYWIRPMCE